MSTVRIRASQRMASGRRLTESAVCLLASFVPMRKGWIRSSVDFRISLTTSETNAIMIHVKPADPKPYAPRRVFM